MGGCWRAWTAVPVTCEATVELKVALLVETVAPTAVVNGVMTEITGEFNSDAAPAVFAFAVGTGT